MRTIIKREGLVWSKNGSTDPVIIYRGIYKKALARFNRLAGESFLLADQLGLNAIRVWSDGIEDQACFNIAYR